jgi:uncharacterized protein YcnI
LVGALGIAVAVLALCAGVASAHVTIDPESVPQGASDEVITFRVPNEMDNANTVGLKVQFPSDHPIASVDPQVLPGWTSTTKTTHLATPITTDDGTVTDVVSEVDWTGGTIPPNQFGEFPVLAMGLPTGTDSLTFKVLQDYDNGQEVAWIEETGPDGKEPDHPAPVLKLTAAQTSDAGDATGGAGTTVAVAASPTTAASPTSLAAAAPTTSTSSSSNALGIVAIIVAAVAVILSVVAIIMGRRQAAT